MSNYITYSKGDVVLLSTTKQSLKVFCLVVDVDIDYTYGSVVYTLKSLSPHIDLLTWEKEARVNISWCDINQKIEFKVIKKFVSDALPVNIKNQDLSFLKEMLNLLAI